MILGEAYHCDQYNCAHAVATEYRELGVDLGDTFDCDFFSLTFMRRLRQNFHRVEVPQDWDMVVMVYGSKRHIGVIRYGRVKHNNGTGASGAVVSDELRYIRRTYPKISFWRLNDQSTVSPDRRWGRGVK